MLPFFCCFVTPLLLQAPPESRFMVKIPAIFFRDFDHPNGALKHILVWSLEFRLEQLSSHEGLGGYRRFELLSGE